MQKEVKPIFNTNWKSRIALFITSQTISMFGSSLVQYALIWYIAKFTNSGIMVAISTVCAFLPQILVSLFAGVWADRYSRKRLIIAADGLIAGSTLVLAIIYMAGYKYLWLLFMVTAIRSFGSGMQSPAVNALIPQIVPEEKLIRVNSINGSLQSIVNLVGPALGGAVLSHWDIHFIMFIDVITAAIGISILITIHVPLHQKAAAKEKSDYLADIKEGVRYSLSHSFIKKMLIFNGVFTLLIVPGMFLNVLMVTRVFGNSYWALTLNEIAFFTGALLGGITMATWGGFKNRIITFALGYCAFGSLTFAIGFIKTFWVYLILTVFTGATMPLFNTPVMVLIQEKAEANMHGRVFSLVQIVSSSVMMIGMTIFGPLADVVKIETLMITSGALLFFSSIGMLNMKIFLQEGLSDNMIG